MCYTAYVSGRMQLSYYHMAAITLTFWIQIKAVCLIV
jgi:hypothetical protein